MTVIQIQIIFPNFQVAKRVNLKVQMRNESNISILGPCHRQIDVTPATGFSENDRQPKIPPFIGYPGVQFTVENQADVISYFDHYVPPELIEIAVEQTNLYAQQQIAKMPRPVTKICMS